MWPDDEWEDEPGSGPLPDPSTRHWRHPSELGAQNAREASTTSPQPGLAAAASGSGGWRWTAGAITVGLAVVAVGVLGLTVTEAPRQEVLTAGSIRPLTSESANAISSVRQTTTVTSALGPAQTADQTTTEATGHQQQPPPSAGVTTPWRLTRPTTTAPTSMTTVSIQRGEADRQEDGDAGAQAGASPAPAEDEAAPYADEQTDAAGPVAPLALPADGLRGPYGPAVYAQPDPDHLLGSFAPVDNQLLTSASAIGGRKTVYLLIDELWIPASVAGSDPMTDVAVLTIDPGVWEMGMPSDGAASGATPTKTDVFIGYCPKELLMSQAWAPAVLGCGPVEAPGWHKENEATAAAPPGAADDTGPVTDLEARTGTVWKTVENSEEIRGHKVYDLMRTGSPYDERMAGAALRSTNGEVVGLVVAADNPSVAAIPIDRALDAGIALQTVGQGGFAWLGMETVSDRRGVRVTSVDEFGPVAESILPGDRMIGVGRTKVTDNDHLDHLLRMAGPGRQIRLTIGRGDETIRVDVTVGDITDRPPVEQ